MPDQTLFAKVLRSNPTGLIRNWVSVTPSDTTDNVGTGGLAIGLYVTVGGDISWTDVDGNTVTVTVPSSFYVNCAITRVRQSGTTASGIFALVSA